MPRDGSLTLPDFREPTLSLACEPCGRRGRYRVDWLMEQHGDAKLTDLLSTLADRPKSALSQHPRQVQGGLRAAAPLGSPGAQKQKNGKREQGSVSGLG
jgi:hypothetical protein